MNNQLKYIIIALVVLIALYFLLSREGFQSSIDSFYNTINSNLDEIKLNLQQGRARTKDTYLFSNALWKGFLGALLGRNPEVLQQTMRMYEEMKLDYQMAAENKGDVELYNEYAERAFNNAVRLQRRINIVLKKPLDNSFISYKPL